MNRDRDDGPRFPPLGNARDLIVSGEHMAGLAAASGEPPYAEMKKLLKNRAESYLATGSGEMEKIPLYSRAPRWRSCLFELWLAWRLGGDERYRSHMYSLVEGLYRSDGNGLGYFSGEHPLGGIASTLAVLYDLDRPYSTPAQKAMVEEMLRAYGADLYARSMRESFGDDTPCRFAWNHAAIAYSGLGLAALALGNPDEETARWLGRAYGGVTKYVEYGITPDGVGREGFFYAGYTMESASYFLLAMRNAYGDATITEDRLGRFLEWYAYETLPFGGMLNNRNDSYMSPGAPMGGYLVLASVNRNKAAAWVWNRLVGPEGDRGFTPLFDSMVFYPGAPPDSPGLPFGRVFPDAGLFVSRTGWGVDDDMLAFTSGEFIGCIHDQSDENSFTLAACGMDMLLDSGYANAPSEGSASQTVGHNSVLIDRRGMAISGGGKGTSGRIVDYKLTDIADFALGDASRSYDLDLYNRVDRALRYVCFVKGPVPYLVTYDDIRKRDGGAHLFEYLLHLNPSLALTRSADGGRYVFMDRTGGRGLEVMFLNPSGTALESTRFVNGKGGGAYADHPLERFGVEASEPGFVVLILPFTGDTPPEVAAFAAVGPERVKVTAEFGGGGFSDEITFERTRGVPGERFSIKRSGRREGE